MTDTTNHAAIPAIPELAKKVDELHRYVYLPGPRRKELAEDITAALDALTRELEAHRSAQPIIRQQLIEQSARIATLEEAVRGASVCLEELVPSTTSGFKPNRLAKRGLELLRAALAPKEEQG